MKTLDVQQLSAILHKTVDTIYEYRRTKPHSLPPRLKIEGTSKLLWLESTVEEWLEERVEKTIGRPRNKH